MVKKRDRLEIIYDILLVIFENPKIGPTKLLYRSNLSPQMFKDYVEELLDKEFISLKIDQNKKTYSLTNKGNDFLREYKVITLFIDNFGL